ncbi:hypothetical protein FPOA_11998 [Fusarium poae]|uniref:Uncharacterized protein n=1 Tax=Fusarium poae TaxID=36050 RepID=A0A1B8A9D6_FUSPO|nr:hypothetical protein FPOA_13120 [Fusarium poae]OBS17076.1 hypothetical protein FPOA_12356 [Fusarium poae]OBS17550.1 hypothetical protein FPOA_11998 [Fusarium poae]
MDDGQDPQKRVCTRAGRHRIEMISDGKKVVYGERRPRLLVIPLAGSANLHSTPFQIHQVCIGHPVLFRLAASDDTLRNAFNPQAYQEALTSILTRRRVPFSAIEWDKFKQLALACNPYIKDSLITSRSTMVRYIAANYDFYSSEIKSDSYLNRPLDITA